MCQLHNVFVKKSIGVLVLLLCLSGCALFDSAIPDTSPRAVPDTAAESSAVAQPDSIVRGNPQAENIYATARLLWRADGTCSDPEKAIALLNNALDIEPHFAPALARRGQAFLQLGLVDDAFTDFTRSIQLHPIAETYAWRAQALLHEGNIQGAAEDIAHALRLDPTSSVALKMRGVMHLLHNETDAACDDFEAAAQYGDATLLHKARADGLCQ